MVFKVFSAEQLARVAFVNLAFCAAVCQSREITSAQARTAVGIWLRREAAPLEAKVGNAPRAAVTYKDAVGSSLFHVVTLDGGGFVVTSADDGIEPVIAFSEGDNLAADAGNPLWALLTKDMPQRIAALTARRAAALPGQQSVQGSPEAEWASLLDLRQITPQGLTSISDVRVAPVVQSHWGQSTVSGFWGSYNCYNYYTPGGYPCGCVATAMAQIMRKHCFPTSSVPALTFLCKVNEEWKPLTMIGGVYSWSNMVLLPDEGLDTAPNATVRAAIGKLCFDAGVSVGMQYASGGSGAYSYDVPDALVGVFGYASAHHSWTGNEYDIQNAILSNLDHGYPVYLQISGTPESGTPETHAVVADGYGFHSGARYIHLNMGWNLDGNGGYQNAWYNVPTVDTTQGTYTLLDEIVYNIFPDTEKKLVSGRVLSAAGVPVASATVYVRDFATGELWLTLKSNSKGMYAFSWDGNENGFDSADLCATDGTNACCEIAVSAYLSDYGVENVWGADLYLDAPATQTVTLDANSGTGGSVNVTARIGAGLPYSVAAPARPGYLFAGFFDSSDSPGGTQYYDANMNPVGLWHDILITTLYARWQPVAVRIGSTLVPYTWFDGFGLGSNYEAIAVADQDLDGHLSWQEYVAGTDPTNGLSVFRITECSRTNLAWSPNLPDRIYTIVGKTNLEDAAESWASPTNTAHRFFRVRVALP